MTHHTLRLEEDDPHHPGFIRRYYACIDVSMPSGAGGWVWAQVDVDGKYVGGASQPFTSEDEAKDDARRALDGQWENT